VKFQNGSHHVFIELVLMTSGPRVVQGPVLEMRFTGWGFSSVVERLPSNCKALGSVPSSEKKMRFTEDIDPVSEQVCRPPLRRAPGLGEPQGRPGLSAYQSSVCGRDDISQINLLFYNHPLELLYKITKTMSF